MMLCLFYSKWQKISQHSIWLQSAFYVGINHYHYAMTNRMIYSQITYQTYFDTKFTADNYC